MGLGMGLGMWMGMSCDIIGYDIKEKVHRVEHPER